MAVIINIETAINACSAVLAVDGVAVVERVEKQDRKHSELLGVFVDEVLTEAEARGLKPEAVAVSAGPGSYTGLRIGVSLAKGLCFGYKIPLIAVETLKIVASTAIKMQADQDAFYIPLIDARRMEVYSAVFNAALDAQSETLAEIITEESFASFLDKKKVYFVGDGAEKCKSIIHHRNACFINDVVPLAQNMCALSERAFQSQSFVDVAYFEPYYLKSFLVTTSKKDVFGRLK